MREAESYQTAQQLFNERRFPEAFIIYERLARAGDPHCQVFLGWMYKQGLGVAKDEQKALDWFIRAASLGSKVGAFYCGRSALSSGRNDEAIGWFHKAAAQEYGPALLWLGLVYVRGLGVSADLVKGTKYLKRAADAGNFFALRELGLLMIRGKFGPAKIPLGFVLIPYAVVGGIVTAIVNRDPEKVMG